MSGFFRVIFKPIFMLLGLILSKWKYSITFIILAVFLFASVVQSAKEQSAYPFVEELGARVLSLDYRLGVEADKIAEHGGVLIPGDGNPVTFLGKFARYPLLAWAFFKTYASLLATIWIAIVLVRIVYKVLVKFDESIKWIWVGASILVVYFIGSLYAVSVMAIDDNPNDLGDVLGAFGVPGARKLFKVAPLIFKPVYEEFKTSEGKSKPLTESDILSIDPINSNSSNSDNSTDDVGQTFAYGEY